MKEPNVIEKLSYEDIFEEMIRDFTYRYKKIMPEFERPLISDPSYHIIAMAAYRETLLRQRINEAARNSLLSFSKDLDFLFPNSRLDKESDRELGEKITVAIKSASPAGSVFHYKNAAFLSSEDVRDVYVTSPTQGVVKVFILSRIDDGAPDEDTLQKVKKALTSDHVKVLTDRIEVEPGLQKNVDIEAEVILENNTPLEIFHNLHEIFKSEFEKEKSLGRDITTSWIISKLHRPGIKSIKLKAPNDDLIAPPQEYFVLGHLELKLLGRE